MPRSRPDVHPLLAPRAGVRRFAAMLALAFAVTSAGLLAAPPAALAWGAGEFNADSESMLISLQNQARASAGRKSLKLDTDLRKVARWRSEDMIDRDYFSHTIKGTSRNVFWYLQHEYGYCFKVAGENIGTVRWEGASVADATNWVFDAFMDSSGHRDNIMGKAWDVVAVGAYKGPGDKFMWTVLFADSCSSKPDPTPKPKPDKPDPTPKPKPDKPDKPDPKPEPDRANRKADHDQPRPDPTKRPRPTAARTAAPTLTPEPTPLVAPSALEATPTPSPTPALAAAAAAPVPPVEALPPGRMRVIDPSPPQGLVDSILAPIVAGFFGG